MWLKTSSMRITIESIWGDRPKCANIDYLSEQVSVDVNPIKVHFEWNNTAILCVCVLETQGSDKRWKSYCEGNILKPLMHVLYLKGQIQL